MPKDKLKESNLVCPKCGKIITNKTLKHLKCEYCGVDLRIKFIPKTDNTNNHISKNK